MTREQENFHSHLEYGLKKWFWDNPTITENISTGGLKKLFALTATEGLVIDVSQFNEAFIKKYYMQKFMPSSEKFIYKLSEVLKECAETIQIYEFKLPITIKKNVYKCSKNIIVTKGKITVLA